MVCSTSTKRGTANCRLVLPFRARKGSEKGPPFRCGGRRPGLRPRTPRCGHLTTAYSPAWGPVNKENDFIPFPGNSCLTERVLNCPARFSNPYLAQAPQGLSRPSLGFSPNHWPLCAADLFRNQRCALFFAWRCAPSGGIAARAKSRSPGRRPPHRNGGPFSLPFRARKGRTPR